MSSKIAVMGYGVVGSGVVEVFYNGLKNIKSLTGHSADIKYILDIVEHKNTGFDEKFISDFNIIVNDPEISVVAEVIGGVNPAYDFTKRCLEAGKSVVTSNKELVATRGAELLKIANENNVKYLFEASVGGGIPIIRPIRMCLVGNNITKIAGIVNGTTNFILTKMFEEQMSFDDALSLAQKLGYAERNPAADIEGHDACRKICILASLVCKKHIYPDEVSTEGITNITSNDVSAAEKLGYTIKLIAYCNVLDDGKIDVLVAPMLVNPKNRLSNIKDVFNGVVVNSDAVGEAAFYGPGAGKLPTASAVVSDIIECVRFKDVCEPPVWQDGNRDLVIKREDGSFPFYIRANKSNTIIENFSKASNIKFDYIENQDEIIFTTEEVVEKQISSLTNNLKQNGEIINSVLRILK